MTALIRSPRLRPVASALVPTATSALRRPRWRRPLAGLGLAAALLGGAACSTPAPSRGEIAEALVDSGLSQEVADCTASALTKSLSTSELAEITERGSGGAPVDDPKRADDSYDKLVRAMADCRDLQAATEPTTTTTTVPLGGAGSSTTVDDGPRTDGAQLNPASSTTAP